MGQSLRHQIGVLRPFIALVAMKGMELDAIGSRSSPPQSLCRAEPGDPLDAAADGRSVATAVSAVGGGASAGEACPDVRQADQGDDRPGPRSQAETDERVAVRTKTTASALFSDGPCPSPSHPLEPARPGPGHERHLYYSYSGCPRLRHRLCRWLC